MNGETQELFTSIVKELAKLQGSNEANWRNHAIRASEVLQEIKEIKGRVYNLPCSERVHWYKSMEKRIGWLFTLFSLFVIGVVTALWVR